MKQNTSVSAKKSPLQSESRIPRFAVEIDERFGVESFHETGTVDVHGFIGNTEPYGQHDGTELAGNGRRGLEDFDAFVLLEIQIGDQDIGIQFGMAANSCSG